MKAWSENASGWRLAKVRGMGEELRNVMTGAVEEKYALPSDTYYMMDWEDCR